MLRRFSVVSSLSLLAVSAPALASGPYLQEQSAKEVGRGFSGGAAAADDASTIYFNPAGMTELSDTEISLNTHLLFVDTQQRDTGSTRTIPGVPTPVATGGSNGGSPFKQPIMIPAGYASFHIGDSPVYVGLGISAPFGAQVKYTNDFFARYDSTNSDLRVINIQPTMAIKLNDTFSIGGGVDIQQIDVKLDSNLPNLSPLLADGKVHVQGDDMSFGWNLGVLANAGAFRFGGHYRSRIKHDLNGSYQVSGLVGPIAAGNATLFAHAPIVLPDSATVSAMYGVGERFRLMATGKWFNWSVFKEIAIYPTGANPAISTQGYKDAWSGALGAEFDVSPKLTLRTGTLYDTTPTVDQYRSTRIPDGDRTWATAGMTYKVSKAIEFNLSYAHVFIKAENLNRTDVAYAGTAAQITTVVRSRNTGNADEVAGSLTLKL